MSAPAGESKDRERTFTATIAGGVIGVNAAPMWVRRRLLKSRSVSPIIPLSPALAVTLWGREMSRMMCPKCGFACRSDDSFCGGCGARIRSEAARAQREPRAERPKMEIPPALVWLLELFPGLLSPLVIVCSVVTVALSLGAMALAAFCLQMGALISAFFIGGSGVLIYWTGMCWLLSGTVCLPVEAMIDFTQRHWLAFVLLTTVPASVFLLITKISVGQQ